MDTPASKNDQKALHLQSKRWISDHNRAIVASFALALKNKHSLLYGYAAPKAAWYVSSTGQDSKEKKVVYIHHRYSATND